MMWGAIRMDFHQQTVHTVVVEVRFTRYVPKHEQTVVSIITRGHQTSIVLLVEVELFTQRLGNMAINSFELFVKLAWFTFVSTFIPVHDLSHCGTIDVLFLVFLEQLQDIYVRSVSFLVQPLHDMRLHFLVVQLT